ncbi:MAG: DUF6400 family protein [Pseudonocardiaceae bacterium]
MTATDSGPRSKHSAELVPFTLGLTAHEVRRLGVVLEAITNWDPAAVLAAETEACSLLNSALDVEQRAVYDLLCEEGVLDARP